MNQEETNLAKIIAKYLNNECDDSERELLESWLLQSKKNRDVLDDLMNSQRLQEDLIQYNLFDRAAAWGKLSDKFNANSTSVKKFRFNKFVYAAAIIFAIISVSFFYLKYVNTFQNRYSVLSEGEILKDSVGDILPATTGAILVNSDGKKVVLSNSFSIHKDGSVAIEGLSSESHTNNSENSYYELIVPKAKIIHFTMFDGSKVWVNANSRLRIPTQSYQNERRITLLSGEAYFEVEKFENTKFIVDSEHGSIEVLGTKFNVNTFKNSFKTTLVEGSVKLINDFDQKVLIPNTSAIFIDQEFMTAKANMASDLAWKNNLFYFNNLSLDRIAKQIEDWYGVKVNIEASVAKLNNTYSGELARNVPLTKVKDMLEFISGLDVRIEGDNLNIINE
ncbi:FecR family protein [Sphingobacterium composti Ten et al. 2007 non Yoo et al. 2007]|uniref:FecR family protein n=1 Tax=Sphingobacterium composti TaxID=363260 RepID=UPI00135C4AF7|nr:FecR family protein [Sphingobacterium composti Ten et al. 2007 non Yoo et al. 2007]